MWPAAWPDIPAVFLSQQFRGLKLHRKDNTYLNEIPTRGDAACFKAEETIYGAMSTKAFLKKGLSLFLRNKVIAVIKKSLLSKN